MSSLECGAEASYGGLRLRSPQRNEIEQAPAQPSEAGRAAHTALLERFAQLEPALDFAHGPPGISALPPLKRRRFNVGRLRRKPTRSLTFTVSVQGKRTGVASESTTSSDVARLNAARRTLQRGIDHTIRLVE